MRAITALTVLCCSAVFSTAQSDCALLLKHGLYNTFRTNNAAANSQDIRNHLCTDNSSDQTNSTGISANVNIPLSFSGGASYNQSQSRAMRSAMCSDGKSLKDDKNTNDVFNSFIDPAATQAFSQCVALKSQGLHVKTNYDEETQESLSISINYTVNGSASPQRITGVTVDTPGDTDESRQLKCSGSLWEKGRAREGMVLDGNVVGMTCSRKIVSDVSDAFLEGGKSVLAAHSRITIHTNADDVIRDFQSVPAPEIAIASPVPIGAIIDWFGYPGRPGTIPANFITCDGSIIPSGPMAGLATPNLNGRVTIGAAKLSEVGEIGGAKQGTVIIPAHMHMLVTGEHPNALRVDLGNGVVNHTTVSNFLVNSKTVADPGSKVLVDTEPPFVTTMKIMRFK